MPRLPARRPPTPSANLDILAMLDLITARLERVADRIESYTQDPAKLEGPNDATPPS